MERFIGDLIDKFAILRYKYRGVWEKIRDTIKVCMALQNINSHEHITRQYIHKEEDIFAWEDMLNRKKKWLTETTYPILNQVFKNTIFFQKYRENRNVEMLKMLPKIYPILHLIFLKM